MIADLRPYSEYKDSGTPWLGRVPGHWETRPVFGAFAPNHDRNHGMKEKTVLSLSYGRIIIKPREKLHGLVPESFETYQIVNPGDIVLRTTDLQNDHTSLRVGMVRDRGIITSAYLALRTIAGVMPEFGFQFLNVWDSSKAIYGYGSGLRQNLDFSHFKRMPVAVPPPEEQAAIVRFLNWANGRLERAIRAKRKVIALLNEQKQAIIHGAVTRGLDPSIPLKPSGIPWLGDIPQHWEVRPLKQLLVRMDYGTSENVRGDGRIRVLTMGHIRDGKVVVPEKGGLAAVPPGLLLEKNDLLFNRTNSPELVGKVGIFSGDAEDEITFASYLVRLRTRSEYNAIWLSYLLNSTAFWSYARSHALVSLHQANLNSKRYGQMVIPIPSSRAEQDSIVERIRSQTGDIERAVDRLEREIQLLHECRIRLVADVVTGKLDVREVAARLPDGTSLDLVEDDAGLDDETEQVEEEGTT
ncbi:MAG: restriction endonuclease subunit S [Alphaproteobacteria bacterium]|nr:restriction endonuclease subunit S [Alphaproteobacteria bacterium]